MQSMLNVLNAVHTECQYTYFPKVSMAIWLRGLECWYLVLGGVAVGRWFEPQSDLELCKDINHHLNLMQCMFLG
jgi:hypothetical protein